MPKLTYLSHSGFIVEGSKGKIAIDPFLNGNPLANAKPSDIRVDYIILTHGHGDHLGDALEIAKSNNATIIAPFELASYCDSKGVTSHPMHIGGAHEFPFGKVKLTIAHHGSVTPDGTYAGNPCGILLTMDNKTFYHAGDTGLFYDMKLIGEMNHIHIAAVPIGDNFTMGISDAVKALEFLKPDMTVPMHFKTFEIIDVNPQDFVRFSDSKGFKSRVLNVGESIEY
jgi:L-ascorbate metabolism protein UlaG (beta-lactamase superfamily)